LFRQRVVAILAYDPLDVGSARRASKALAMRLFSILGVWISLVMAGAGVLDSLSGADKTVAERNDALRSAVRDGDLPVVQALLDGGADVNAKDEVGTTFLMHAVLNGDVGVVKLLLSKGADANAQNKKGAMALFWALHDPNKMKLLLDHGAKIPTEAVFVVAGIPGGSRTLKLLADRGANLEVNKGGFTPLGAATRGGDLTLETNPITGTGEVFGANFSPGPPFTTPNFFFFEVAPYSFLDSLGVNTTTANRFHLAIHLASPVPEPSSLAMLAIGLASVASYHWRRQARAR
jgi:hypothetical protein